MFRQRLASAALVTVMTLAGVGIASGTAQADNDISGLPNPSLADCIAMAGSVASIPVTTFLGATALAGTGVRCGTWYGGALSWMFCWGSQQPWGEGARRAVLWMTGGQYSRC